MPYISEAKYQQIKMVRKLMGLRLERLDKKLAELKRQQEEQDKRIYGKRR